MTQRGRPKTELVLTSEERGRLLTLTRRRRDPSAVRRARIVLRCASGQTNLAVARLENVAPRTVGKWRRRFVRQRLRGLFDAPRSGAPRKVTNVAIGRVVQLTLAGWRDPSTLLSTRALAAVCGVSRDVVDRIWRTFGLEGRDGGSDAAPVAQKLDGLGSNVCDVVGVLLHPLGRVLALRIAEGGRAASNAAARPVALSEAGPHGRRSDHAAPFRRCDLALIVALEKAAAAVPTGADFGIPGRAFAEFLMRLEGSLRPDMSVRLVANGFALHRNGAARLWLERHRRFDFWLLPPYLGWIVFASMWLARGATDEAGGPSHPGTRQLHDALTRYCEPAERPGEPFDWIIGPEAVERSEGAEDRDRPSQAQA